MVRVELASLPPELLAKLWGRIYSLDGREVFVPDVVADRYGFAGERLSCGELQKLLSENWGRLPRLFRRYALADCRELALRLVF
jgi:hypothetical protein